MSQLLLAVVLSLALGGLPALRTREMFDTVLAEASAAAPEDPLLGEEWAGAAYALASLLPEDACPRSLREVSRPRHHKPSRP